jgi:hypothetical protein
MNELRIVFLDIDGVLCTRRAAGWTRNGRPFTRGQLIRRPVRALDGNAIQRLNSLCSEANAHVVITSMWRLDRDVPSILRRSGFQGEFHTDWRTDADGPLRSDEIGRWLEAHDCRRFVVIDDSLTDVESLRDNLVLTDNYLGLEYGDIERATRILVSPLGAV